MSLDDRLSSPQLQVDFHPRNSDQETTFGEFLRLCGATKR